MLLKLCWKNIIFVIIIANGNMNDIEEILAEIRRFNQERDWDQFHNGKNLAIAIPILNPCVLNTERHEQDFYQLLAHRPGCRP